MAAGPDEEQGDSRRPAAAEEDQTSELSLKERIYLITDVPESSSTAAWWAAFIVACIVFSTVMFILETIPALEQKYPQYFSQSELFCVSVFAVEYVTRFIVTPDKKIVFVMNPFNIIDLLAILPFFIELFVDTKTLDLRLLRAIRLVRIFRLFKVGKYSTHTQLITRALGRSTEALTLLVFFLGIAIILFATLMYTVEQGEWNAEKKCFVRPGEDKCSPFESIPHAFYWAVTTMTTVGYGDTYPLTNWGQFITCISMICGILVIALPITMIGNVFVEAFTEIQSETKLKRVQEELQDDDEVHRKLYMACHDVCDMKDECDALLRKVKHMLAAVRVVKDNVDSASALDTLEPTFDILQSQSSQCIEDLSEFAKTTLPAHYSA